MKRVKNLIILACMIAVFTSSSAFSQIHLNDTLSFVLIPGNGLPNPHKPHRAPANVSLPTVVNTGNTLLFIGTGTLSFSYVILYEEDEMCDSADITLTPEQEVSVSLASLPCGTYRLILAIAGREYEGEFTIE